MATRARSGDSYVIPNRHGHRKTRSIVVFNGGPPDVGVDPLGCASSAVVRRVKDVIGDPGRVRRADGSFRPEEIVAIILARLTADAERALDKPVTDVLLTVPASFDAVARRAVEDAAGIAGLRVVRIVNEPTAAALAYQARAAIRSTALVYALGGGAFDASVVRLSPQGVEVLATRGDRSLGGWDWDSVLMRLLQQRLTTDRGPDLLRNDADEAYLSGCAERLKRRLTVAHRAEAVVRRDAMSWRIPVTRTEFELGSTPLLDRTRVLVHEALADARLRAVDLDCVLLVGDATGMPMVRRMLRRTLRVPLDRSVRPDEAVALGAALLARAPSAAAPAGEPEVHEVATLGLGVLARDLDTGAVRNVVVVPAGAALPASGRMPVTTSEDGQTRAVIEITQGNSRRPAEVRVLGRHVFTMPARPAGARIDIACAYDASQQPQVEAVDVAAGRSSGLLPVRAASAMSEAEVLAATDRLATLLSPEAPLL
jgi:molecular chaperone DnaK